MNKRLCFSCGKLGHNSIRCPLNDEVAKALVGDGDGDEPTAFALEAAYDRDVERVTAETGCIEEVKKIVTDSPGRQVCFTGHSLGAAVAAIFALHVLAGLGGQDRRRVRCSTLPSALSLVPS